jgi:hypothetical protein
LLEIQEQTETQIAPVCVLARRNALGQIVVGRLALSCSSGTSIQ